MNRIVIHKLVKFSERESNLYMPNEIFNDLQKHIKKAPHLAFAYSYVYFTTWLYRYAKYFNIKEVIDNKKIKECLGYNPNQQTLDYLIKKDGLLDQIGYTKSVRDYPLSWSYDSSQDEQLSFLMSSEIDAATSEFLPTVPKRFFLKKPLKAFYRAATDEDGEEYEAAGTFYDVSNTHNVLFEVLVHCLSLNQVGCIGFYLYSYLKHKNDMHSSGYDISLDKLSYETSIPRRTLIKYLGALRSYRMIDVIHNQEYFSLGIEKGERMVSTYITKGFHLFSDKPVEYKRMEFKSKEDHLKLKRAEKGGSYLGDMPF